MSLGTIVVWVFTLGAGAAVVGLSRGELTLDERVALAMVSGVVATTMGTLLIGLVIGLRSSTVFFAATLVVAAALATDQLYDRGGLDRVWRDSWRTARSTGRRSTIATWGIAAVALVAFTAVFSRTLMDNSGTLQSSYIGVWGDWSLHSTVASSFVHSGNLPATDPWLSGQGLRYPPVPDLHSAILQLAGASLPLSLWMPGVVMCVAISMLVVALARRLTGSIAVGAVAMLLCLAGGGVGFTGVWWDGCRAAQVTDCSVRGTASPAEAAAVVRAIPGVVAHMDGPQSRAYDNLFQPPGRAVGNVQWYTPVLAWWLPQRNFPYGFAVVVSVLLLLGAGVRAPPGTRSPFILAGLLAGTLPYVHAQSLFVLVTVVPFVVLWSRRREWWWFAGSAALLALPRLAQLVGGGNGVAASCTGNSTVFPYLEPGWKWNTNPGGACVDPGVFSAGLSGVLHATPRLFAALVDPGFWGFWVLNTGLIAVVTLVVTLAAGVRLLPVSSARRAAGAVLQPFPRDLLRFFLPFMVVFAACNVVVFQPQDWDNTKLLAYWHFAGALLVAVLLVRWWRASLVRAGIASVLLLTLVASSGLGIARVFQQERSHGGPYTWATPDDIALASAIVERTPPAAIFLTHGGQQDPINTLAGRTVVLGYDFWIRALGEDPGNRADDVRTVYQGCPGGGAGCIPGLLARYSVDFVAVERKDATASWFSASFPVLARSPNGITVYDVRSTRARG